MIWSQASQQIGSKMDSCLCPCCCAPCQTLFLKVIQQLSDKGFWKEMCDLKQTELDTVLARKRWNPTSLRAQQTIFHSVSYNLPVSFQPPVFIKKTQQPKPQNPPHNKHCHTISDLSSNSAHSQVTCPRFTRLDRWMLNNVVENTQATTQKIIHPHCLPEWAKTVSQVCNSGNSFSSSPSTVSWTLSLDFPLNQFILQIDLLQVAHYKGFRTDVDIGMLNCFLVASQVCSGSQDFAHSS